jgi:hypothetical protein
MRMPFERLEEVIGQIRQTAAEAFEIKARTSFDVGMQGYALLEAFAANDGRAHDKFAKTLAQNALEILPPGGGGSRASSHSRRGGGLMTPATKRTTRLCRVLVRLWTARLLIWIAKTLRL